MNYQLVQTITPPANSTGTWTLDGQLIPNPLSFGACTYHTTTGGVATDSYTEFVNSQVAGATHADRLSEWLTSFKRWRLAYASVTIYQDGPDLANQGTVVVCQKPVDPQRFNINETVTSANNPTAQGLHHCFHMDASDLPSYVVSQAMPNAYFGKSKEGAYIPLKLTHTHQRWQSAKDLVYQSNASTLGAATDPYYGGILTLPQSTSAVSTGVYPFLSVNDLHIYNNDLGAGIVPSVVGTLTSDFCNDNWADFSFRNMAVTTSLSMFFRFGFEVQCQPGSLLAPHLKLSPEYDPMAVETYFAVSRELKDAYPADYNDLGKIWDVISSIAKKVSPFLSAIPVAGPALSMAVPAVAGVGDSIREMIKRTQAPSQGNVASQADKEAVIALASPKTASMTIPRPRRPRVVDLQLFNQPPPVPKRGRRKVRSVQ